MTPREKLMEYLPHVPYFQGMENKPLSEEMGCRPESIHSAFIRMEREGLVYRKQSQKKGAGSRCVWYRNGGLFERFINSSICKPKLERFKSRILD